MKKEFVSFLVLACKEIRNDSHKKGLVPALGSFICFSILALLILSNICEAWTLNNLTPIGKILFGKRGYRYCRERYHHMTWKLN